MIEFERTWNFNEHNEEKSLMLSSILFPIKLKISSNYKNASLALDMPTVTNLQMRNS
jgi:hypothetical protein